MLCELTPVGNHERRTGSCILSCFIVEGLLYLARNRCRRLFIGRRIPRLKMPEHINPIYKPA